MIHSPSKYILYFNWCETIEGREGITKGQKQKSQVDSVDTVTNAHSKAINVITKV